MEEEIKTTAFYVELSFKAIESKIEEVRKIRNDYLTKRREEKLTSEYIRDFNENYHKVTLKALEMIQETTKLRNILTLHDALRLKVLTTQMEELVLWREMNRELVILELFQCKIEEKSL